LWSIFWAFPQRPQKPSSWGFSGETVVAMTVITLFVPCIANFFIIIKERGLKTAVGMVIFIIPFAITVGGLLNLVLRGLGLWR
jgi:ferrous iron transport protein B